MAFVDFFRKLFTSDFMPHGHCYFWRPELVWLNVISDGLIVAAYYSIPITLLYFIRRRPGLRLRGLILMFGGFILACGTTHLMSIWDLWHSTYRLEAVIKVITAALSVATAIAAVKLSPMVIRLATPDELEKVNQSLHTEISARKEAEEKLRSHIRSERLSGEAKIRSYFEAASQAILAVSSDGRIVLVNQRTEEMFGYAREELLGQELEMLLPGRLRGAHAAHRASYFTEPRVRAMGVGLDLAGRRKDGTEFPVEIGLGYAETEEGVLALGLVSDITDRKRVADELTHANAELVKREAQLRSYLESAPQAILAVSSEGRILLVNRRTEEMFGYTRGELLGQELELLLPRRYRDAHLDHRAGFFKTPRVRDMNVQTDLSGRRKNGTEFPAEVGLSYIETTDGLMALGLVSDITERKRAVDELARANAELLHSNSELEQFASIASHDLQEPLRMITSYLSLLEHRYRDSLDADSREFIHFASDGARRMKGLIEDLLRFSRIGTDSAHFHTVSGDTILENALINLKTAVEESGAQVTSDALPSFFGDPGLLTQVFQNLIGNAIKFQKQGHPQVHISVECRSADWVISVRDNGIGIQPQHAERIFQIFQRLHGSEEYPGTGVGLAVSKKIVERHGGQIWLLSQPGEGSTFYFSIPNEDQATTIR